MITLGDLAAVAARHPHDLSASPVAPVRLGERLVDSDEHAVVMGALNLSRDSYYRESIAFTVESAIRRGRTMAAAGADLVDLGAESTNEGTERVDAAGQTGKLVPVIRGLAEAGVCVSVECSGAEVARAGLEAGARVVNYTGGDAGQDAVLDLAGEHGASVVLCRVPGADARDVGRALPSGASPEAAVDLLLEHFEPRVQRARDRGFTDLVIDPALGFVYTDLYDTRDRMVHQSRVLAQTYRLRSLGLPLCHALPHAFELFEDQFRHAEPMFAVLARLGGTGVLRTHEVPPVRAVVDVWQQLEV